jgi:putative spermidine/putrescine transport system permease protein
MKMAQVAVAPPKTSGTLIARMGGIPLAWLGVLPFFLFGLLFILLPSLSLVTGTFQTDSGALTLDNMFSLARADILNAYSLSIQISVVTAVLGGLFGFFIAYALVMTGVPSALRTGLVTVCGVASNFAGVPLAFAFVAALGRTGFITGLLRDNFNFNIYDHGFNLYSFFGLSLTYLYFQFPLMVLVMMPALEGLRREWREASQNLGASSFQYWRLIALPILLPSILGTMILLFGNAFGAYATAYALTGGRIGLVTIQIGAQIRGDVLHNPGLGYAMGFGMVLIMAVSLVGYSWLQGRTARWLQ